MELKAAQLRQLLKTGDIIVAPGAYDALSAKLIEQAGFKVLIMGGYSAAASRLAQPDVGCLSMSEMAQSLKIINDAVDLPVIADGDTGYGNPLSVRRTVQEYEMLGAAAIIFEDQVFPKRCGHMQGKEVIPAREHEQKIKAACEAKSHKDTLIVARTDARAPLGLAEAIDRGKRYLDAGAEALFIEAPQDLNELASIGTAFPGTVLAANMVEGGRTPILTAEELHHLGFKIVFWPCTALYTVARALGQVLSELKRSGTTDGCQDLILSFGEFNQLVGLDEYLQLDQRYKS
ncbi:MAG: oxaloacetate decarboxylase [Syntrophomonadaceae bacterium]